MASTEDLIKLNGQIGEMEQRPRTEAVEFFRPLLSDALVFRRANGRVVGKAEEGGFLATLGASPFASRLSEDISVTLVDDRALVTLVVVGTRKDDGSAHRYRNIRLFSRDGDRWLLELWYNYEIAASV